MEFAKIIDEKNNLNSNSKLNSKVIYNLNSNSKLNSKIISTNKLIINKKDKKLLQIIELPLVRQIKCNLCNSDEFLFKFAIRSNRFENFQVVSCKNCELIQVNPQPNKASCKPYYSDKYFLERGKSGYNDYYSQNTENEIIKVYNKNLNDLDFLNFENELFKNIKSKKKNKARSLDVGCASGYFVKTLTNRGWNAEGIEIAKAPVIIAKLRKIKVIIGDFLENKTIEKKKYNLISFWASLEHMHNPKEIFFRCHELLEPNGRLLISTCNYGILAKILKEKWRFMNVPEHLYFFNLEQLKSMANETGFKLEKFITYGSGLTRKKNMKFGYKILKFILDRLVKFTGQGDMIALHFSKK